MVIQCVAMISNDNKKPAEAGFFRKEVQLLDFRFFVDHMFTRNGIVFFDLHFARHVFLVFGGGVVVAVAF
jgi:hypothetical protein